MNKPMSSKQLKIYLKQLVASKAKEQTDPFPRRMPPRIPSTWYLHEEEGGKPLPEFHLRLTAEVPAG